jgi:hypothetical protein
MTTVSDSIDNFLLPPAAELPRPAYILPRINTGPCKKAKTETEDLDDNNFMMIHSQLYLLKDIPWPPSLPVLADLDGFGKITGRISRRAAECLYLYHTLFAYPGRTSDQVDACGAQFVDLNTSAQRTIGEDASRDPWRPQVQTITMKAIIAMRRQLPDGRIAFHVSNAHNL